MHSPFDVFDPRRFWIVRKFHDIAGYLIDLDGNLKPLLGKCRAGHDYADGAVQTNAADENDFYGKCCILPGMVSLMDIAWDRSIEKARRSF